MTLDLFKRDFYIKGKIYTCILYETSEDKHILIKCNKEKILDVVYLGLDDEGSIVSQMESLISNL